MAKIGVLDAQIGPILGPGPEPLFRAPVKLERRSQGIWPYALPGPAQKGLKIGVKSGLKIGVY